MKQIITITPTGQIETLKRKKGKGLDIAPLVKRQTIKRISLVEWDEDSQQWYLRLQLGPLKGAVVSLALIQTLTDLPLHELNCPHCDAAQTILGTNLTCLWDDYDDAVKAEVEIIERARQAGHGRYVGTAFA